MVSTNKDTVVIHKPFDGLKVSVHTADEEHPMSQLADKPHELGFEVYAEDSDREGKILSPLESAVEVAQAV